MLPLVQAADPSPAPAGLRERKKRQARAAIADAALELFAETGFDDTTVAEVARRAGVSPASVARHFPTKESLLFPGQDVHAPALARAIAERPPEETPYDAVVGALRDAEPVDAPGLRRMLLARRAIARSTVLRGRAAGLLDTWRDTIAEAAVVRGADPADARVLATVVVAVLDDVADQWALAGGTADLAGANAAAFAALDRSHRSNR